MRIRLIAAVVLASLAACAPLAGARETEEVPAESGMQKDASPKPESRVERISYAAGFRWAGFFRRRADDYDVDAFVSGIRDRLSDREPKLNPAVMEELLDGISGRRERRRRDRPDPDRNEKEAREFLAANRRKEGVHVLPSGVQYRTIKPGDGPTPQPEDTVAVHYRGMLPDGEEFDSSYSRGGPAEFKLSTTITGWRSALTHMKEGATWKVWVPPELGYGRRGAGRSVEPNQLLTFEMRLLEVKR